MTSNPLASSFTLPSGQVLSNRIVKVATSETLGDRRSGAPTESLDRLYETWARGGAGLLITGNVVIDWNGRESAGNVVITGSEHRAALSRWAEAAHRGGAQLWMQISHAGRQASRRTTARPVAPSAVKLRGFGPLAARPRALEDAEIREIIAGFARAASEAIEAGFDGVQIHGAHGYLVSQFLSPRVNRRDDDWGGDPIRRRRFLLEIVGATRAAIGRDRALAVKLNSADFQRGGFDNDESIEVARALEEAGVDLVEISGGNYESPAMVGLPDRRGESTRSREAYFLDFAEKLRREVSLPLLLTGGLRNGETMRQILKSGAVDLIGMARPLIAEPDLASRLVADPSTSARFFDLATGIKRLDAAIEPFWHQRQLERLAAGKEPDPTMGRWSTLVRAFVRNYAPTHLFSSGRRKPQAETETGAETEAEAEVA